MRRSFLPCPIGTWCNGRRRPSAPVPDASQVVSGDDLAKPPGFDVSHFDEARVKDEDVWWVPGDVLGSAFPFDGALGTTWVAMAVHIQPELCRRAVVSVQIEGAASELNLTVIAKEKFVLARAEHPHWTTRFTTLGKFLMARIVALWNRDTLETTHPTRQISEIRCGVMSTNSERSMISNPFVQRMAILAFKKMRSYDSDGRKKSCQIAFIIPLGRGKGIYVLCKCGTTPSGVAVDQIENSGTQEP